MISNFLCILMFTTGCQSNPFSANAATTVQPPEPDPVLICKSDAVVGVIDTTDVTQGIGRILGEDRSVKLSNLVVINSSTGKVILKRDGEGNKIAEADVSPGTNVKISGNICQDLV